MTGRNHRCAFDLFDRFVKPGPGKRKPKNPMIVRGFEVFAPVEMPDRLVQVRQEPIHRTHHRICLIPTESPHAHVMGSVHDADVTIGRR